MTDDEISAARTLAEKITTEPEAMNYVSTLMAQRQQLADAVLALSEALDQQNSTTHALNLAAKVRKLEAEKIELIAELEKWDRGWTKGELR